MGQHRFGDELRSITEGGETVENSLGLSLKIRICYRNRRRVVVT
ncbi:hypothetical protein T12_7767 [Trichinella patagoniensis]|uniref:Uncharacterized protein n=1 Tax=Trichinella patagoniensis TaxID=990121 RepID=A0A0V0V3J1_9BILA|nr:hypothetical protein T12_7767 [Trichinella patagoniensis]